MKYKSVASVNFQGWIVAFARGDAAGADIYFDVLSLRGDSGSNASDWSGFRPLDLSGIGSEDAGMPFRVLTSEEAIYIFRQSARGSLLVDRLRLVREALPGKPDEAIFTLQTAADEAIELPMVAGLADGNFDVQFLPSEEGRLLSCAIFVANPRTHLVDVYELPIDNSGRFALPGKHASGPDFSFKMHDKSGAPLELRGAPSAVHYLKQARVKTAEEAEFSVRRGGHVLLACKGARWGCKPVLATIDLEVGADGRLARPARAVTATPLATNEYRLEFDAGAWLGIPWWVPQARYSVDLWIHPKSSGMARQQILGSAHGAGAPYLCLVDGDALEAGFTGRNGKTLRARTAPGSVRQQAWTRVQLSFDAAQPGKFVFRLNGAELPCSVSGEGDQPAGIVNAVGAASDGFIGCIDQLKLFDAAQWQASGIVAAFDFDTVDLAPVAQRKPPITPNRIDVRKPAVLHGARLVRSSSPAAVAAGAFSRDTRGLGIHAAYIDDIACHGDAASPLFLLPAADELVRCYFTGSAGTFSVVQLDTAASRPVYEGGWRAAGEEGRTGRLQFVASRAGAFMNNARVLVAPTPGLPAGMFCDVALVSPSGTTETWRGVPRALHAFCSVLAGAGCDDPADPRVREGQVSFYDHTGERTSAWLPLPGSASRTALGFVSRSRTLLPLASLRIERADPAGATCDISFTFKAPRWQGETVTSRWTRVPTAVGAFLDTLGGRAADYDYHSESALDVATYSLSALGQQGDAHRLVICVRPQAGAMEAIEVIDGIDDGLATVTIELGALHASWEGVPRAQADFASVIEGAAMPDRYDYAKLASGDYKAIGAALIVANDGAAAQVANASLGTSAPLAPEHDLRAVASLLAAFATGPYAAADRVPALDGKLAATAFQGASDSATGTVIGEGSALFQVLPAELPAQGEVALVADTLSEAGKFAPLVVEGVDGSCLGQSERRALSAAPAGYVSFGPGKTPRPAAEAPVAAGGAKPRPYVAPVKTS